jgi:hypothetical protein
MSLWVKFNACEGVLRSAGVMMEAALSMHGHTVKA